MWHIFRLLARLDVAFQQWHTKLQTSHSSLFILTNAPNDVTMRSRFPEGSQPSIEPIANSDQFIMVAFHATAKIPAACIVLFKRRLLWWIVIVGGNAGAATTDWTVRSRRVPLHPANIPMNRWWLLEMRLIGCVDGALKLVQGPTRHVTWLTDKTDCKNLKLKQGTVNRRLLRNWLGLFVHCSALDERARTTEKSPEPHLGRRTGRVP